MMKHTTLKSRLFSAAIASASFFTLCGALSASAAADVPLMGDLNYNRKVGLDDAQSALKIYVNGLGGVASAEANAENGVADIDMNGSISLSDAGTILSYYTQTMGGKQPLWADLRKVTYADGTDFYSYFETDENGAPVLDSKGQPVLVKPNADRPFQLTGMYIEIGCASGAPGETVSVPVYTAGLPKLAGFQLSVSHDAALKPVDITTTLPEQFGWNPDTHNIGTNPTVNDTRGCLVMAQANDLCLSDGCIIGTFSYQIPADAKSGDIFMLSVATDNSKFITKMCASYQYTALSGIVTVEY